MTVEEEQDQPTDIGPDLILDYLDVKQANDTEEQVVRMPGGKKRKVVKAESTDGLAENNGDSGKAKKKRTRKAKTAAADGETADGESSALASNRKRAQSQVWTNDQKKVLRELVGTHGTTNWTAICNEYNQKFGRSLNQLKSYWHNILSKKEGTD